MNAYVLTTTHFVLLINSIKAEWHFKVGFRYYQVPSIIIYFYTYNIFIILYQFY